MVAKAQQKTEDTVEPQEETVDASVLLKKIEELLQKTPPAPHLTEAALSALAAPLDPRFLKSRKGQGNKVFTYADLDYLERRAQEVDPGYGVHFDATTPNVIICSVTILGVTRSATAGYFLPAKYEVWDSNKKEMVPRNMNAETAHTIVTRAQAAAERRAFAMFGLGAELWASSQADHETEQPQASSGRVQSASSSSGEFRAPTEARINFLGDLGVPASVASRINSWSRGKDSDGKPISDVSTVINALLDARGKGNKGPVSQRVWEQIVKDHAAYALSSSAGNTDDEDYDEDDF